MIRRALITGASGFIGGHLSAHLTDLGVEVVGAARGARPTDWTAEWRRLDVRDDAEGERALAEVRPDVVFHLAGVARSSSLAELLEGNVVGTQQLLAAASRSASAARIVIAGSAAEYGLAPLSELPLDEHGQLRPLTSYGISKCAQTLVALNAARAGADVVVTRTFNLVGPGEPSSLVCGSFASQIAAREAGLEHGPITVGNLDSQRDFLDVRDAVRAYVLVATNGAAGEIYNVCSGTPTRISDVLQMLTARSLTPIDVRAVSDALHADVPVQFGDPSRLSAATGWTRSFALEQSLEALLASKRAALALTGAG